MPCKQINIPLTRHLCFGRNSNMASQFFPGWSKWENNRKVYKGYNEPKIPSTQGTEIARTNYGCRLTPENLPLIVSHVRDFGLNLDYLKDNLDFHTEDGAEVYVIFSVNDETGGRTFTEFLKEDFFANWRFVHEEDTKSPWLQIIDRKL